MYNTSSSLGSRAPKALILHAIWVEEWLNNTQSLDGLLNRLGACSFESEPIRFGRSRQNHLYMAHSPFLVCPCNKVILYFGVS